MSPVHRSWWSRLAVLSGLAVPGVLYVWIPLSWERDRLTSLTGDEPHYVIVADALVRDHRLSVKTAYDRDAVARKIVGPIDWWNHTSTRHKGTFSIHNIGIPVLIAPLFRRFGVSGARLTLAAVAALVPFLFFWVARSRGLARYESAGLAFCTSVSLPFLAGSGQVYPDLVTGVLLLALASVAFAATLRPIPLPGLAGAGMLIAALPWLHLKNILPAAGIGATILLADLSRRSWRFRPLRAFWLAAPSVCSLALLGWYNWYAFGNVLGPYTTGEAARATVRQASMIFLGLHLDQAQGIFVQQPLFLLALPGLALLARRSPLFTCGLMLTYLCVVFPNSFHECWYGCFSFAGRFMWAVAPLWFFPLVFFYSELKTSGRTLCGLAGVAAVLWQIRLMTEWRAHPDESFLMQWSPYLWHRNSLFGGEWRLLLPSFYNFDRYLTYTPNLVAIAVVAALVGAGVVLAVCRSSHRTREAPPGPTSA